MSKPSPAPTGDREASGLAKAYLRMAAELERQGAAIDARIAELEAGPAESTPPSNGTASGHLADLLEQARCKSTAATDSELRAKHGQLYHALYAELRGAVGGQ